MNWQNIVVMLIVLSALVYAGSVFWKKTRSFSTKKGCAADCGCDSNAKPSSQ